MGRCVLNPFTINHHLLGIKESSRNEDTGTKDEILKPPNGWWKTKQVFFIESTPPTLNLVNGTLVSFIPSQPIDHDGEAFTSFFSSTSPSSYHLSLESLHQDYIPPISFINNRLLKSISDMSQIMSLNCLILSMTLHSLQQEIQISWKGIQCTLSSQFQQYPKHILGFHKSEILTVSQTLRAFACILSKTTVSQISTHSINHQLSVICQSMKHY